MAEWSKGEKNIMDNIYTEEMKLYDKVTEAALINLHGIGIRNNNKLNLGCFNMLLTSPQPLNILAGSLNTSVIQRCIKSQH